MTTYTIAYDQLLFACVPDGNAERLEAEIRHVEEQARVEIDRSTLTVEHGLTLTDEEPEDESRIVWMGHDLGWLTDVNGTAYKYAIR